MAQLSDGARELLQGQNFAHLVTLMKDGSPQVTPVWIDVEGNEVVFNTADGRLKQQNLDRDPRVALSVADAQNPYRYVQIRGRVVAKTTDGADEHIDKMAKKYLGQDSYPWRAPNEQRLIYRILPERVQVYGS